MRHFVAMAALLTLSAGVARGDDQGTARDHYLKGTRSYELGLYDEAIAEYMAAYKAKDDPALLFNLGQAHRLAGHPAEALRFYKTYLAKVPEASNRADVEAKIRELKELVEKQKPSQAEPAAVSRASSQPAGNAPASPELPGGTSVTPEVGVGSPVAVTVKEAPAAPAQPGRGKKLAGVVLAAGGVALVGTGIIFAVLAKQASDQLTQLDQSRGVFDPSKESAGRRDQVLEGVFVGVGAAALATGAVLYFLGAHAGPDAPQAITLAPAVAPHCTGATLRMVF